MRKQSASYFPFSDVRQTDFRVDFGIIDNNAKENAEFTHSGAAAGDVLHLQDGINNSDGQASLEHNMWTLDSAKTLMAANEPVGWWSEAISNSDATYEEAPYIFVYFGGYAISTIGITLNFDAAAQIFPTVIRLTTYDEDGQTILKTTDFENNKAAAVLQFQADNYYYLKIEFIESCFPGYRVRLSEIIFGIEKHYDRDSIENVRLIHSANITAESIPSAQLEISVDNSDRAYDLLSPQNVFAYLQEGTQPLSMRAIINGEVVELGELYYTSAKVSSDGMTATIVANDRIVELDGATFMGRSGTSTLSAMVNEILEGTGIEAEYEEDLANVVVNSCIPEDTLKREALRLVAQAACCTCWINREGLLHFGALDVDSVPAQTISDNELYNFDGISISQNVGAVKLVVQDVFAETEETTYTSGTGANIKVIHNPCAYNGQAVADWLYSNYQRRRRYAVQNQGDPALEIGDTVKIYDAYKQNLNAAMTGLELRYDGVLSIITSAVGER